MSAVSPMPTPLVDIHWLRDHLDDPQLVIVDCRFALADPQQGRREYSAGHLPGAFYLDLNQDLSSPVGEHGGRHPLPSIDQFVEKLAAIGITSHPATQVVVYDATKGAFASRLWWLLRWLGHEAVSVLDGGFPAWQSAGYPLTTSAAPVPHPGKLEPRIRHHWVVDRETIRASHEPLVLVDARSPERYRGDHEPIDPIPGALPTAINYFWQTNLDPAGKFKPAPELSAQWSALPVTEDAVFYCGSGVTACVNLLAQAVMGHPLPRLYVGGWSDWCSYEQSESQLP